MTISPEAKQAAAVWEIPSETDFMQLQMGPVLTMALREAYAYGYDTASRCPDMKTTSKRATDGYKRPQ